ncbi:transglutaminase domain-containing protein [Tenacibaculum agarivorans]|uniref:transglutaminase domain-containing protein n=1 Tax=Tenacibaculum agarivorans TaxID=1908389 RepID=UPI00094BBB99|nr:transglutaminase domain-containing protein [Tenacibaculum agarivorans]
MIKKTTLILILFIGFSVSSQVTDFNHIDFTIAENTAKLYENEDINNLPLLTHKLTYKLTTEVEKFRAIYYWVCHNIRNDYTAFLKINQKRKKLKNDSIAFLNWHNEYKKKLFNRLLKHKKTVCTGYAYLIKEMAFIAGIECVIVDGYGRNITSNIDTLGLPNHSWNAVKLNEKWYLCDATWSSGYTNEKFTFLNDYNDGYFLTDPTLFAKSHQPLLKKWLLDTNQTNQEFISAPIIYDATFEQKIIPLIPNTLHIETYNNEKLYFKFKTLKTIHLNTVFLIYYTNNGSEIKLKINDLQNNNGFISFNHILSKKGIYDFHVKMNSEIISSYTVYVERQKKSINY